MFLCVLPELLTSTMAIPCNSNIKMFYWVLGQSRTIKSTHFYVSPTHRVSSMAVAALYVLARARATPGICVTVSTVTGRPPPSPAPADTRVKKSLCAKCGVDIFGMLQYLHFVWAENIAVLMR